MGIAIRIGNQNWATGIGDDDWILGLGLGIGTKFGDWAWGNLALEIVDLALGFGKDGKPHFAYAAFLLVEIQ